MNKTISLEYIKKEQKDMLEHFKYVKGYNYQECDFGVPYWIILALQTELSEIVNAANIHKWWNKEKVNRNHVLEECCDFIAHAGNLAVMLDEELNINLKDCTEPIETLFNRISYQITTLNMSKNYARKSLKIIMDLFGEFVIALGFDFDEIKIKYYEKLQINYRRFE